MIGDGVGKLQQPRGGHRPVLLHPAGDIHAQHLQVVAEVGRTHPAGAARAAELDGLDDHAVAFHEAADAGARHDLGEGLVADDPAARHAVIEVPLEDVEIGTADADPAHPQERFAVGRLRHRHGAGLELRLPLIEDAFIESFNVNSQPPTPNSQIDLFEESAWDLEVGVGS